MCYITGDLLAADLSFRLPRYLFLPSPSVNSGRRELAVRIGRGGGPSHWASSPPARPNVQRVGQTYVDHERALWQGVLHNKRGRVGRRREGRREGGMEGGGNRCAEWAPRRAVNHIFTLFYFDPGPLVLLSRRRPCQKYISIDPSFR